MLKTRVYINYRMRDDASSALVLHRALVDRLGAKRVVRDTSGPTGPGTDGLHHCAVLVAVIGPNWVPSQCEPGLRCLDERSDWVRRQLAGALRRGIRVLLVLLDDTPLPGAADLPEELAGLPGCPVRRVRREHAAADTARIVDEVAADPQLGPGEPAEPASVTRLHVGDLPEDVPGFTGRVAELHELLTALPEGDRDGGTTVVLRPAHGRSGFGVTALAVHAAHLLLPRYPDGQLFIDLRTCTPGRAPAESAHALDILLRCLGVPAQQIPRGVEERVTLWREQLADRRVLIVLDNAMDEPQVRPLLPGAPGCLVLVTSRTDLPQLAEASRLRVDALGREDALELFARDVAGPRPDRLGATQVTELCGRRPLAVRLAARTPHLDARDLARRLAETRSRLPESADGKLDAAFHLAYQHRSGAQRQMFRRLGLHPGPTVDAYTAAALDDTPLEAAREVLDGLVEAHLLERPSRGRYRFHGRLGRYARALAEREDSAGQRRAAVERVLDYYLHVADLAEQAVDRASRKIPPEITHRPRACPPVGSRREALDWFDAERVNLLAASEYAADHKLHNHAWQIPRRMWHFYFVRSHLDDWQTSHQQALIATRCLNSRFGEGEILNYLAGVHWRVGQYERSLHLLRKALAARRDCGDRLGEATTLDNFGVVHERLGNYRQALHFYQLGLAIDDEMATQPASHLLRLGHAAIAYRRLGFYEEAVDHAERAATLSRERGDPRAEAKALDAQGAAHLELGQYEPARRCLYEAVAIRKQISDNYGEAQSVIKIGRIYERLGNLPQALRYLQQALTITAKIGDRADESEALNGIGVVYRKLGRHPSALDYHRRAMAIARTTGVRFEQAGALEGIGHVMFETGDFAGADENWREALALYESMDVPEAEPLRGRLTQTGSAIAEDVSSASYD